MCENLPLEVLSEILCRFPTKFLLRCRCVCKSWRSLIGDPSFISLHRRHSPSFLLIQSSPLPRSEEHCFEPFQRSLLRNDSVLTLSDSSLPLPSHSFIIDTCHGLLCIVVTRAPHSSSSSFIICNPSLRRFLILPKPLPFPCSPRDHSYTLAFGFDSRNHDYKIVSIVTTIEEEQDNDNDEAAYTRVQVYSLASGLWTTLPAVSPPITILGLGILASHGFVNGLVHWGARHRVKEVYQFFVLSFDFVDQVFHEVDLPESVAGDSSPGASVTVVRGCNVNVLTVYHVSGDDVYLRSTASIWMMKEYGVVQSWSKIFYFDFTPFRLEAPSFGITIPNIIFLPETGCIVNDGEILFWLWTSWQRRNGTLYLLDMQKKTFVNLQIGADSYCLSVLYYAESLVLLDNIGALISY